MLRHIAPSFSGELDKAFLTPYSKLQGNLSDIIYVSYEPGAILLYKLIHFILFYFYPSSLVIQRLQGLPQGQHVPLPLFCLFYVPVATYRQAKWLPQARPLL